MFLNYTETDCHDGSTETQSPGSEQHRDVPPERRDIHDQRGSAVVPDVKGEFEKRDGGRNNWHSHYHHPVFAKTVR